MITKNTEAAFRWIVDLLQKHSIPFQISGGFAARLYGSQRKLHDIDIGIPDDRFEELLPELKQYITYGPAHYVDEQWDLKLVSLTYEGQDIDIAGRTTIKFFDTDTQSWAPAHQDLTKSETKEVYSLTVPVIPKAALIAYKKKLGRAVDIQDVQALEG
ncbi:MAG: hypothetical protein V4474_04065 [Patescibacteria group bacterium]